MRFRRNKATWSRDLSVLFARFLRFSTAWPVVWNPYDSRSNIPFRLGHMTLDSKRPATPTQPSSATQPSFFQEDSASKQPVSGTSNWAVAYTDGGSRGNPGPSGYGVVILGENGSPLAELSEFLGMRTNNVAEYSGLLAALEFAATNHLPRLRVVSDSELMVKQIRGQYRVQSPDLRPLYEEAKRRISQLQEFQIVHVLRGKNKKADELANKAMDRGMRQKSELKAAARSSSSPVIAPPVRPLRGIVKNGKINLLEGSIPEGTIVVVMPEKSLAERAKSEGKS